MAGSRVRLRAILLDLDGTLLDSRPGIVASYNAALRALGHAPAADFDMTPWIGPPIDAVMAGLLAPFGDDRVAAAVAAYRADYASAGLFACTVYPGVREALAALADAGAALYVVTSKRREFAVRMLDHGGLSPSFAAIYGSEPGGLLDEKTALIRHVLADAAIDPASAAMVGDRAFDIVGARDNGLPGIGVLWGYGTRAELEHAGAARLLQTSAELAGL